MTELDDLRAEMADHRRQLSEESERRSVIMSQLLASFSAVKSAIAANTTALLELRAAIDGGAGRRASSDTPTEPSGRLADMLEAEEQTEVRAVIARAIQQRHAVLVLHEWGKTIVLIAAVLGALAAIAALTFKMFGGAH